MNKLCCIFILILIILLCISTRNNGYVIVDNHNRRDVPKQKSLIFIKNDTVGYLKVSYLYYFLDTDDNEDTRQLDAVDNYYYGRQFQLIKPNEIERWALPLKQPYRLEFYLNNIIYHKNSKQGGQSYTSGQSYDFRKLNGIYCLVWHNDKKMEEPICLDESNSCHFELIVNKVIETSENRNLDVSLRKLPCSR